jgi:glucose-fructose oxidoreductase
MIRSSRRRFLSQTTTVAFTGAAAMALAPHLRGAEEQTANKKLGFAIVGLGRFGAGQLLRSLPECKLARPAALVSGHPDKAKSLADKYGIDSKSIYNYENFDSIKDNPDVDVVYVVLPNSMHKEYTIRAAKAGKHVMCEKPMAINARECQEMIDACKQANRKLQIGYRLHFEPTTQYVRKLCQDQKYGPLRVIESSNSFNLGPNEWRSDKKLSGGGPVFDLGVYSINGARYFSGREPTHVTAQVWQPRDDPRFVNSEATMAYTMKFPDGLLASCTTSYDQHGLAYLRACSTRGEILMQPSFAYGGLKLHIKDRGKQSDGPEFPSINQFAAEMDAFAQSVLNNKPILATGEDGMADLKVVDALYRAVDSGKWEAI